MKKPYLIFMLTAMLVMLGACKYKMGFYEKTVVIPGHEWSSSYRPVFTFDITDTSSYYNIYVVMRHNDAYHYNNIWLDFTAIAPGSTADTQKLNLKLGDNSKWLGSEMDDIVEHRILVNQAPVKLKYGKYNFMLQNVMREDPLPEILNIGVRISKIEP